MIIGYKDKDNVQVIGTLALACGLICWTQLRWMYIQIGVYSFITSVPWFKDSWNRWGLGHFTRKNTPVFHGRASIRHMAGLGG